MMLGAITSDVLGGARLSSFPAGGSLGHGRHDPTAATQPGLARDFRLTYCASDDNPAPGPRGGHKRCC
jgi:hypothetical protein